MKLSLEALSCELPMGKWSPPWYTRRWSEFSHGLSIRCYGDIYAISARIIDLDSVVLLGEIYASPKCEYPCTECCQRVIKSSFSFCTYSKGIEHRKQSKASVSVAICTHDVLPGHGERSDLFCCHRHWCTWHFTPPHQMWLHGFPFQIWTCPACFCLKFLGPLLLRFHLLRVLH